MSHILLEFSSKKKRKESRDSVLLRKNKCKPCNGWCVMFGTCERSQFLNHALYMFWVAWRIFFESEVIFTHPLGLLSLFQLNFNLLGLIRFVVSNSETMLPSAKGKSLILFAIFAAQVSHWMAESRSFNMYILWWAGFFHLVRTFLDNQLRKKTL